MDELIVKELGFRFDERKDGKQDVLFEDFHLTIGSGDIVVVTGPSGCGKSSLLNLIAGFYRPQHGQVQFDDKPVDEARVPTAYIFQDSTLFPWLTVAENVAYGADHHGRQGREVGNKDEQVLLLEELGIEKRHHGKYPHELSGGMKQRDEVARALAYRPKLLLMDEPFRSLDEQNRKKAQVAVYGAWKRYKPTIVFVTHSVIEAAFLGHRIVVLKAREAMRPTKMRETLAGLGPDVARDYKTTYLDPNYLDVCNRILAILREEVDAQEQIDG